MWWIAVVLLMGCQPEDRGRVVETDVDYFPDREESLAVESIDTARGPIEPMFPITGPLDPITQQELPPAVLAGSGDGFSEVAALDPDAPELSGLGVPFHPDVPRPRDMAATQAEANLQQGMALLQRGRFDEALAKAKAVARENANDPRPFVLEGLVHIQREEFGAAIAAFNIAIELNEEAANAYLYRGNAYLRLNDFSRASRDFSRVLELQPHSSAAYLGRATAHLNQRNFPAAREDSSTVIRLEPTSLDAYVIRYWTHLAVGDREKARADYDGAVRNGLKGEPAKALLQYLEPAQP